MKKKLIKLCLILISTCLLSIAMKGQNKSNRGKEFWLGYGYNSNFFPSTQGLSDPVNTQELALYISTEQAAVVTVTINGTSWLQTLNIPANTVDASILIPKSGVNDARILSDGLSTKGIHIISDVPVAAYAHMYNLMYSAATMLMPVETYGYSYYSINYDQSRGLSSLPPTSSNSYNIDKWYSWFYVVASENNTRLLITPSDTTKNGWLPGQTYTVTLNKGETYSVFGKAEYTSSIQGPAYKASKDMTGSRIVSIPGADGNCHPIGLFSGSGGIHICKNDGGEGMQQQVFPTQAWGTRYLTYHTLSNTNTDINETNRNYYRISVQDPTTIVRRNGVVMTGLIKNFYYEYLDSLGGDYIEADKPILVAQYTPNANQCWMPPPSSGGSYGDPEMFYLSPIEQGQKSVLFYASRNANINYVYTNIIVPTVAINSLKVDGNPISSVNTRIHPNNPNYTVAVERLTGPAAQHTITSDSTFTAIVYGLGYYESYGYNVGTNINNLNHYSAIKNTFNTSGNVDTFTCRNTPVRLFAKIAYPATSITWKLSQVTGITPNVDSVINNPVPVSTESINGRTYYVYTLQQDFSFANTGTYNIPISYTTPVIPNCNQTENGFVTVVVKPGPQSDFTFPSACPNQSIVLTGTSTTTGFNIASYLWDFPDNTTQTTINATKSFPAVGAYNVRYRIFADNGCAGDTTKVVNIGSPLSLSVQGNGKACADSVFTFISSIPVNAANPPTWHWDFGDGQTTVVTTGNTVTYSYTAFPGNRTVRHSVSFAQGCSTDTVNFSVPLINSNPSASFSFLTDTLCENKPVQFNSTLTGISSWLWNFGSSTSNSAAPLNHTFTNAGSFNVSLTVKDVNGCGSLPATNTVVINATPAVNAGPDKPFRIGSSVSLDASIPNPANYDFLWTPSTYLNSANILKPIATPDKKMTYTIVATDKLTNCIGTDSMKVIPISVLFAPTAFTPNDDSKNDLYRISGADAVTQFNIVIFNRYGQVVFETSDKFKGWDGKINGKPSPAGGYVYIVKYRIPNWPDMQMLQGSFILIR